VIFSTFFISIFVITFENFITLKNPIVLILNDSDTKYNQKIKEYFKGERGVKIYDKNLDENKILLSNPKLVIDINEDKSTKGIYVNASSQIFEKVKGLIINSNGIPFIGKRQINKNKQLELRLFKHGIPYIYIEFPTQNYDFKTILKSQLVIISRLLKIK